MLEFDDFLQIVLPCEAQSLRDMVTRRPNQSDMRGPGYLDVRVEIELTKLIEMEVHFNRIVEQ